MRRFGEDPLLWHSFFTFLPRTMAHVNNNSSRPTTQTKPPSAAECYRCWTAYDALKEATLKLGYLTEAEFDETVVPAKMVGKL